jgi:NAD(P)H-dependent FMN reductase
MKRLAILTGSDHGMACQIADRVSAHAGPEVDVLDLTAACLPDLVSDVVPTPPAVRDLAPWLAAADGFLVVACPPHLLSLAMAWCPAAWQGKQVIFLTDPDSLPDIDRILEDFR